ncbi:MAG: MIP/aquaporin family protein [Candidatus Izemoplasmatales bacterium]
MVEYTQEFLGTMILVLLNNGIVANVLLKKTKGNTKSHWWMVSIGAGLAVMLGIFIASTASLAFLNPAIAFSMFVIKKISFSKMIWYIVSEMLGGMTGALLVYLAYKNHYDLTEDKESILSTFVTTPAIGRRKWNVVTEIIATFILASVIVSVAFQQITSGLIPLIIGFTVTSLGLSLGGPTGFAMNPARDFGPRLIHHFLKLGDSHFEYAFVPILGPMIGALLGTTLFTYILGGL